MGSVSLRMADMQRWEIPIGYVNENLHTQVRIDCKKMFDEYPNAVVSLAVLPPKGDAYPDVVTRDGDWIIWDILAHDVQYGFESKGAFQLTFTSGEIVAKSPVGRFKVTESIVPNGTIPDPIADWIAEANIILGEIPVTISESVDNALEVAKESGEFDGKDGADGQDGFSPIVQITDIAGGHRVTITDSSGAQSYDVLDGADGQNGADGQDGKDGADGTDGFSPTVAVTDITGGHRVTITDAQGSHVFDVLNGQNGADIDDSTVSTESTWSSKKIDDENSALKTEINDKYEKPTGGIPSSDMSSAVQASLENADSAYQKPQTGIPLSDLADNTESVSGTTPSITGVSGHRYICGEVATLTITAPASGIIDVVFESGSTATVLTVSSAKTGVTAIKWANGFDPTALEANTTYEINILDGEYGVSCSWT